MNIVKQERSLLAMIIRPERAITISTHPTMRKRRTASTRTKGHLPSSVYKHAVLFVFTALLLFGSIVVSNNQLAARAADAGPGNGCSWYRVHWGDTLSTIAASNHTTIWTLARVNHIWNVNLIFVGQELCIPYALNAGSSGLSPNGAVRWYAYNALQWSTPRQVAALLRQTAIRYGLPTNLLLAIAWQE